MTTLKPPSASLKNLHDSSLVTQAEKDLGIPLQALNEKLTEEAEKDPNNAKYKKRFNDLLADIGLRAKFMEEMLIQTTIVNEIKQFIEKLGRILEQGEEEVQLMKARQQEITDPDLLAEHKKQLKQRENFIAQLAAEIQLHYGNISALEAKIIKNYKNALDSHQQNTQKIKEVLTTSRAGLIQDMEALQQKVAQKGNKEDTAKLQQFVTDIKAMQADEQQQAQRLPEAQSMYKASRAQAKKEGKIDATTTHTGHKPIALEVEQAKKQMQTGDRVAFMLELKKVLNDRRLQEEMKNKPLSAELEAERQALISNREREAKQQLAATSSETRKKRDELAVTTKSDTQKLDRERRELENIKMAYTKHTTASAPTPDATKAVKSVTSGSSGTFVRERQAENAARMSLSNSSSSGSTMNPTTVNTTLNSVAQSKGQTATNNAGSQSQPQQTASTASTSGTSTNTTPTPTSTTLRPPGTRS